MDEHIYLTLFNAVICLFPVGPDVFEASYEIITKSSFGYLTSKL